MSTTLANDVRNQCSVINDNSGCIRRKELHTVQSFNAHIASDSMRLILSSCSINSFFSTLTYVMLLQKAVQGWQVLNNKLSENSLVRLDSQQSGGEVRWRKEVFNQGTHHP